MPPKKVAVKKEGGKKKCCEKDSCACLDHSKGNRTAKQCDPGSLCGNVPLSDLTGSGRY